MLVLACGRSSLRFRPTLNVTAEIIQEGLARLDAALTEVGK
jgi:4-aminobutyrate aminotransferase-like enzyme